MIPSTLQLIAAYLEERGAYILWSTSTDDDEYILWANNHSITVSINDTSVYVNTSGTRLHSPKTQTIDLHDPDSLERIYEITKTPTLYSIGSGKIKTAYSAIPQKVKK